MPDSVLAAIIAGTATLSASLLQLRSALLREATRGQSATRRKGRIQLIILLVVVGGAAIAGFALSQWLSSGERLAQNTLQRELQARVAEISRTASQLELTRAGARAEIEAGDRKSTRLNSSHSQISYAVFCLKKQNNRTST